MARKIYQRERTCFALKCDIRKFFASIDHEILLEIISRKVKSDDLLRLIRTIIDSFGSEADERESCSLRSQDAREAAPIGNLTSQLFANIYLNEFDQFVKHDIRARYYARYTDDFVLLHHDRAYLENALRRIERFLSEKLKLLLHPDKVSIRKITQGIDFLGYTILPHAILLRTKTKRRVFKKLRIRVEQYKASALSEESFLSSVNSYFGIFAHANAFDLKRNLKHQLWELLKESPQ